MKNIASEALVSILTIGNVQLAIPQKEVISIELIAGSIASAKPPVAATFFKAGYQFPIYSLSQDMQLIGELPAPRHYFVLLAAEHGLAFGIACDQTASLAVTSAMDWDRLPDCMRLPSTPVESLLYYQDKVVLMTDTTTLWRFIHRAGQYRVQN